MPRIENEETELLAQTLRALGQFAMMATCCVARANGNATAEAVQNAPYYSWGAVGTPAVESAGELAARALAWNSPPAEIMRLIPAARPEGKLYLLCVVRKIAPRDYAKAKAMAALTNETRVSTFTGNVLTSESAAAVLLQIEASNCGPLNWTASKASGK